MSARPAAPRAGSRGALLLAALLLVVVERFVPYGRLVLYPFTLFATWVHEMGHGLTALATGGRFAHLAIFADASGQALISTAEGVPAALAAAGGLLAPPWLGALVLAAARGPRRARVVLAAVAGAVVLSLGVWVRTPVGWLSLGLVAALLGLVALRRGSTFTVVTAQLLGLSLGLDAVRRLDYLFAPSARVGGRMQASDVSAIAAALGGPLQAWGVAITVAGAFALGLGLRASWREGAPLTPGRQRP